MRLFHAILLGMFAISRLGVAQTTSGQTAPPAENPEPAEATGWTGFAQFQGSSTSLGAVSSVDLTVGYAFTPHFSGEAGFPLMFVRSPFPPLPNHDWIWTNLLTEPYLDVQYAAGSHGIKITSVVTGTIPVSSSVRIYSTGRFGVDFFNHIERGFNRFTPFLNLGAANGTVNRYVFPRPYSLGRPYQTLGFIADSEAGASFQFRRRFKLGASLYALKPGGPQKVFSRLVAPNTTLVGDGSHNRIFNSAFETVGPARTTRDNGFSGWLELTQRPGLTVQIGYSRSVRYALDSVTLVVNFNGTTLLRGSR